MQDRTIEPAPSGGGAKVKQDFDKGCTFKIVYCRKINGGVQMIKAVVAGACGRMGIRIIHMIEQSPAITLSGAFERKDHPHLNEDAGQIAGLGQLGISVEGSVTEAMEKGEVLIDFTTPEATLENVRAASQKDLQ